MLLARVQLVQTLDEEQVGQLLDDRERVRDAAGPHGVPDSVDLGLQLAGDHDSISPVSIESSNRLDLEVKPLRGCPARWWSPGATAPSDTMVSGALLQTCRRAEAGSLKAHGPTPKARSTILASPTMPSCRAKTHHLEALDRGVSGLQRLEPAHRADELLELAMVGLDDIVEVLHLPVPRVLRGICPRP